MLEIIKTLSARSGLVSVGELRAACNLRPAQFDAALVALANAHSVSIHRDDRPKHHQGVANLLLDGCSYNAISIRRN